MCILDGGIAHIRGGAQRCTAILWQLVSLTDNPTICVRVFGNQAMDRPIVAGWLARLVVIEIVEIVPHPTCGGTGGDYPVPREETRIEDFVVPVKLNAAIIGAYKHTAIISVSSSFRCEASSPPHIQGDPVRH